MDQQCISKQPIKNAIVENLSVKATNVYWLRLQHWLLLQRKSLFFHNAFFLLFDADYSSLKKNEKSRKLKDLRTCFRFFSENLVVGCELCTWRSANVCTPRYGISRVLYDCFLVYFSCFNLNLNTLEHVLSPQFMTKSYETS